MTTYTKLNNGSWGLRVRGTAKVGQKLTVSKKDGTSKIETVSAVLWSGDGITLCAIAASVSSVARSAFSTSKPATRKYRPGMDCPCCGSEPLNAQLHCWECGFSGK